MLMHTSVTSVVKYPLSELKDKLQILLGLFHFSSLLLSSHAFPPLTILQCCSPQQSVQPKMSLES